VSKPKTDGHWNLGAVALVVTIVLNLTGWAYHWGVTSNTLATHTRDLDRVEARVTLIERLDSRLSVLESELKSVNGNLLRLERALTK
jgi:hypothetical protein